MKIVGIKMTHDASVAGIEDGKLLFCVELEKLRNNPRYAKMKAPSEAEEILKMFNFTPDVVVLDGWKHSKALGRSVASYHEFDSECPVIFRHSPIYGELDLLGERRPYKSHPHIAGHILGAYVTAPWAKNREPAYTISWDGGQNPRVHLINPEDKVNPVRFVGVLHELYSIIYGIMGYYWGPYEDKNAQAADVKVPGHNLFGGYDKPGKLMSYIALGTVRTKIVEELSWNYARLVHKYRPENPLDYNQNGILEHELMRAVKGAGLPFSGEDHLASVHQWLESMLVNSATEEIPRGHNLIFTGGSALNIKWNSALRDTGHFKQVWVPPFPNDSGSGLGAAACEMALSQDRWHLDWDVYAGPDIRIGDPLKGWNARFFDLASLAKFFAERPGTPVLMLNGRAEIGPRALGNRSILCSATIADNKDLLNDLKKREPFRPVAPICTEEDAPNWFSPGTPDPYMLFDHEVRLYARKMIPAIVHLDNTARLQTVNAQQNKIIHELLHLYKRLTGIPLLCNTSANFNGSGFFPDLQSAMEWGKVAHIWSDCLMWSKES